MLSGTTQAHELKLAKTNKAILLIGDSGTGKTTFLRTMPKPFVAMFDPNGKEALVGAPDVTFKQYEMSADGWDSFRKDLEAIRKDISILGDKQTFALDSLTFAADACLASVLKKAGKPADAQLTKPEWGDAIRQIKDVMAVITTLPIHNVVTAHIAIEKDELTGGIQRLPLIYGKELPGKLPAYFTEVWFTSIEFKQEGQKQVVKYRIQLVPDMKYTLAKTQLNKNGKLERYESPDFVSVLNKASGN